MRSRHSRYFNVTPWVAEALTNERWFGDGSPTWTDAETSQQAEDRRLKNVRFLKKHGGADPNTLNLQERVYRAIGERLESCDPGSRCLSGACPECNRALQRFFVSECDTLLKTRFAHCQETVAVSLVYVMADYLDVVSLESMQRNTKRLLRNAGVQFAFGGIDLSFNQDGENSDAWAFQLWLIVPTSFPEVWSQRLRNLYTRNDRIKRPILIKPFDGNLEGLAYALKTDFQRRVNYTQEKVVNGEKRICQNTSNQPLRVAERLKLYPFLDRVGLSARIFLLGARPTRTESGISIVKLGGNSENSESAETPELPSKVPS